MTGPVGIRFVDPTNMERLKCMTAAEVDKGMADQGKRQLGAAIGITSDVLE